MQASIDHTNVFTHEDAIKLPQLLQILCQNECTNVLKLFMNLPLLHKVSYSSTTQNMQIY